MALTPEDRRRTAVFVTGRVLRREVDAAIQSRREQAGETLPGLVLKDTLAPLHLTREEQKDPRSYRPGQVLELGRPLAAQGLPAGLHEVLKQRRDGRIDLRLADGRARVFDPKRLANNRGSDLLQLHERADLQLNIGDPVRWTANDRARCVANGDTAELAAVNEHGLRFRKGNGHLLDIPHGDPMLRRVDLGYAANAHASQGATKDAAILVARSTDGRLLTANMMTMLFTRARERIELVTDDLDRVMARAAGRSGAKTSALETVRAREDTKPSGPATGPQPGSKLSAKPLLREPPEKQREMEPPTIGRSRDMGIGR
jgi:hypothetical protein